MSVSMILAALAFLLVFGFLYNAIVGSHIRRGTGDFMARFVALGCFVIVAVITVVTRQWLFGALMLCGFVCGGLGMGLGSWQRREKSPR